MAAHCGSLGLVIHARPAWVRSPANAYFSWLNWNFGLTTVERGERRGGVMENRYKKEEREGKRGNRKEERKYKGKKVEGRKGERKDGAKGERK